MDQQHQSHSSPPASFPTWSFDKPCPAMQWTPLMVDTELTVGATGLEETQLLVIGVHACSKKNADDGEASEEKKIALLADGFAKTVDQGLKGALSELLVENAKTFTGKAGTTTPTLRAIDDNGKSKRYVMLGLGSSEGVTVDDEAVGLVLGKAIATICTTEKKIEKATVFLPGGSLTSNTTIMRDLATAFYQELYMDNRYRTGDNVKKVEHLQRVHITSEGTTAHPEVIAQGQSLARGVILARDIVNAPHNVLNSLSLAETAQRVAAESPSSCLKCRILDAAECEKRGMGAYLGVARGSETPPQFIHLTYTPPPSGGAVKRKVGIVGKGLLFDTGGYNIKTGMMELMKFDCGGAAAVLGAARAIGELTPPGVEAHFIVAACENMINDRAMVPSDILTASNGKTIEVMNTDAEGRLTLADALVYADKEVGCEKIIELSTLTGSCMVSLGKEICGVWTNNDDLAADLDSISKVTGEKSWRMPMAKEYNVQLESKFADLKNIGTRYGGSITAALFLQNFVDEKKPFAHIDIAGPAWNDQTGATGFGTKMIAEWIKRQGK